MDCLQKRFSQRFIGIICGLLTALIWGGFPVITRLGVTGQNLNAWDVTFIRFATAAILTLPIVIKHGWWFRPSCSVPMMVIGIGFPYILVVAKGLEYAPVQQFAAITPSMMIVLSAVMVAYLRRTMLSAQVMLGISVIMLGAILMIILSLIDYGYTHLQAYALFLLGALLWAGYTVCTKEIGIGALQATALVSFWSAISMTPIYFMVRGTTLLTMPWSVIFSQAFYQGFLVSVLALFFYSKAIENLGSVVGATFAAFVPGLAACYAWLFLNEPVSWVSLISLALVSIGMISILYTPRLKK